MLNFNQITLPDGRQLLNTHKNLSKRLPPSPLIRIKSGRTEFILKNEGAQPFGSYKIRGVLNFYSKFENSSPRNIYSISAGNLAQSLLGLSKQTPHKVKVFIPETAPKNKMDKIKKLGGEYEQLTFKQIWELVEGKNLREGEFAHPLFEPAFIEGYSSLGMELLNEIENLDAVVIPFGLGGLFLGIARALKEFSPQTKIFTAEVATAAPLFEALRAGAPIRSTPHPSFVDAIGTPIVLEPVFRAVGPLITGALVSTIDEVEQAFIEIVQEHQTVIEGAAACAYAAAKKLTGRYKRVAVVLSGSNIDQEVLASLIAKNQSPVSKSKSG